MQIETVEAMVLPELSDPGKHASASADPEGARARHRNDSVLCLS